MSTITPTALQSTQPPVIPKDFNANQPKTIRLYPLSVSRSLSLDGHPQQHNDNINIYIYITSMIWY